MQEADGDCFEVAGKLMLAVPPSIQARGAVVDLCHGVPVMTGGEHVGLEYVHAWLEITEPDGLVSCFDRSNGHRLLVSRSVYYAVGTIETERVVRYSLEETKKMLELHEHWGPWDLSLEWTSPRKRGAK